jgi:translation elongation factor EF-1beta
VGAKARSDLKNSDGRTALEMARICAGFAKGDKAKAEVLSLLEGKAPPAAAVEVDEEEDYAADEFENSVDSPVKSGGGASAGGSEVMDLWGDESAVDEEAEAKLAAMAAEHRKKHQEAKTAGGKSQQMATVVLNVKPWDDTTDMAKLEACVRKVCHSSGPDAIVWGEAKLMEVGYGIKSLKISSRIIRDLVSIEVDLVRSPPAVACLDNAMPPLLLLATGCWSGYPHSPSCRALPCHRCVMRCTPFVCIYMQIGEIEELEEYVQSVDLIDVVDDPPSASAQPEPAPGPADGQQCKQCYDRSHEGRIDASDGAHALPTSGYLPPTVSSADAHA